MSGALASAANENRHRLNQTDDALDGWVQLFIGGGNFGYSEEQVAPAVQPHLPVSSYVGTGITSGPQRAVFQFDWNAGNKPGPGQVVNTDGFLLDPLLITSALIRLNPRNIVGSPRVKFYLMDEPQPVDWDTTVFPGPVPPRMLLSDGLTRYTFLDLMVPDASGTRRGWLVDAEEETNILLDPTILNNVIRDDGGTAAWNGKLHIVALIENEMEGYTTATKSVADNSVEFVSSISTNAASRPRLEMFYNDNSHNGWMGSPHGPHRGVRDDRYGTPARSDELVEDGFKEGIWVHPWDVDPDDPYEIDRPTNPLEGVVDNKPVR